MTGSTDKVQKQESQLEKKRLDMQDRLASIIRVISGRDDLRVVTKMDPQTYAGLLASGSREPEKEWFYNRKRDKKTRKIVDEYVYIPAEIHETSEDVAMGKAAHEAGHVLITRYERFVPEKTLKSELGLGALLSSAEERPTDAVVKKHRAAAGQLVDIARKDSIITGKAQIEKSGQKFAVPRFAQLCDLIVYGRLYDEYPEDYDPEVVAAYERIKENVKIMEDTLPERGAKEQEVMQKARERYKTVYRKLWPEVKKFVEQDKEQEEMKQMLKMMQAESRDQLEQLQQSLEKKLKEELKRLLEEGQISGQISKKLLDILGRVFDSLPLAVQLAIEKAAIIVLETTEDKIVQERASKMTDAPMFTHGTVHQEQAEQARLDILKQAIEERKKAAERNQDVYEQYYQQVREFEEDVYRTLQEYFSPNLRVNRRLTVTGARLNLPAVFRLDAARGGGAKEVDVKIFETSSLPEKKDYAITLLVDLSGSMEQYGKTEEAFKGVIILSEVLNRLGIKFEIKGFQDQTIDFKNFNEGLDDEKRKKVSGMLLEVSNKNPDGHNQAEDNFDGPCLLAASRSLAAGAAKDKFLIVISDGQPCSSGSMMDGDAELHEAVRQVITTTDQKLIGLGLGPDTEHVKSFYPVSMPNIQIKDFAIVLGELLKTIITKPRGFIANAK